VPKAIEGKQSAALVSLDMIHSNVLLAFIQLQYASPTLNMTFSVASYVD
jgi:hypothetical protein